MLCSGTLNSMVNTVHERAFKVILGDNLNGFGYLSQNNKDICSQHKNNESVMIEILKVRYEFPHLIMDSMFETGNKYFNFRNFQEFLTERKRTVHYSLETLSYWSPQLWSLLPENITKVEALEIFKRKVKNWVCDDCPCRSCKPYLQNIGFL